MPSSQWITLSSDDIESSLNAGELDQYRQHAATVEDPLTGILEDVTAVVRGHLAARYQLPASGIPVELRAAAIDIAIYRLAKRVALDTEGDPQRKRANDDAMKLLAAAAAGEFGDFSPTDDPKGGRWGSEEKIR
jgi:phage gp36-like protein